MSAHIPASGDPRLPFPEGRPGCRRCMAPPESPPPCPRGTSRFQIHPRPHTGKPEFCTGWPPSTPLPPPPPFLSFPFAPRSLLSAVHTGVSKFPPVLSALCRASARCTSVSGDPALLGRSRGNQAASCPPTTPPPSAPPPLASGLSPALSRLPLSLHLQRRLPPRPPNCRRSTVPTRCPHSTSCRRLHSSWRDSPRCPQTRSLRSSQLSPGTPSPPALVRSARAGRQLHRVAPAASPAAPCPPSAGPRQPWGPRRGARGVRARSLTNAPACPTAQSVLC